MSLWDAMQYAIFTLGSIGAGGGIVVGLSSWLGKVWAERIARKEVHEQQLAMQDIAARTERVLAEFRERSEVGLWRLEAEVERQRYVHTLQFKQEFGAYRHIWRAINEVRRKAIALRPVLDRLDPNEPHEVRRERRLKEFWSAYNVFADAVEPEKPFYPKQVYDEHLALSRLLRAEAIKYEHEDPHDRGYWESASENAEQINESVELACAAIRRRLGLLTDEGEVVEERLSAPYAAEPRDEA